MRICHDVAAAVEYDSGADALLSYEDGCLCRIRRTARAVAADENLNHGRRNPRREFLERGVKLDQRFLRVRVTLAGCRQHQQNEYNNGSRLTHKLRSYIFEFLVRADPLLVAVHSLPS